MKKPALLLAIFGIATWSVRSQVSVEVAFDQDQFLRGEAIKAAVRITNLSGRDLHLGGEDDWLNFRVESRDGKIVHTSADVPVKGEFVLESGKRATKRVNLEPYFNLGQAGKYSVTAEVRIKDWDEERKSRPTSFYVIEGAKLWEQEFGVPKTGANAGAIPEVRKYTLQQANYVKGQLRLYLRVSDQSGGQVLRTALVGTILSFSHPEPQVDKESNLHLIYQTWARAFTYSVFNPDGELVKQEIYDYVDSRPRLHVDNNGVISVLGGVKRIEAKETATSLPATPANDLQAAHP